MYRVVFVFADGSRVTQAAGVHSIDVARRAAVLLMPPSHRPAAVEIGAGSLVEAGGVVSWRGNGGVADDGQVTEAGRVLWRAAESRRGAQTVEAAEAPNLFAAAETAELVELPAGVLDGADPAVLTLFDPDVAIVRRRRAAHSPTPAAPRAVDDLPGGP